VHERQGVSTPASVVSQQEGGMYAAESRRFTAPCHVDAVAVVLAIEEEGPEADWVLPLLGESLRAGVGARS
jgi:hypothetical protein